MNIRMMMEPWLLGVRLREIARYSWRYGKIKVFFMFRRQSEWLVSIYNYLVTVLDSRSKASQKDFEDRLGNIVKQTNFKRHLINYMLLYEVLAEELGEDNMLAIPYESLN